MELIYGEVNGGLVFIERERALELERLFEALGSSTWGDLEHGVSPERWREILSRVAGPGERAPAADSALDPDEIPGFSDGDWPEWPAREMLNWMPAEVSERHGWVAESVLNGRYLHLDPTNCDAVVTALEELGFSCDQDEALVLAASGFG